MFIVDFDVVVLWRVCIFCLYGCVCCVDGSFLMFDI